MTTRTELPKIAYLSGQYPAVSLTFIQREIEALRALGVEVVTCSARRTPASQHLGPAERAEAAATFNVISAAKNPVILGKAAAAALARPGRLASAAGMAWKTRAPGVKAHLYQLFYLVEAIVLARHLRTSGVTHLHNHFVSGSATVAMLAARLAGVGFSFTLHGPADLTEPKRWHLGDKIAEARFVACISHFARSQAMLNSRPEHWGKLRIIHCGVMPERYRTDRTPHEGTNLVFVGRLAPVKGLRVLFEALPEVFAQVPDLTVTIVGDGEDRKALEAAARPFGDRVVFTGYRSQAEVAETLAAADGMVLPSFAEGVPVVLMEAMASGLPVIATRVAGVEELVENGTSGFVVPPGDAQGLAARIVELCRDPARRVAMGEAGRRKVLSDFVIRDEASRLLRLFSGDLSDGLRPRTYGED